MRPEPDGTDTLTRSPHLEKVVVLVPLEAVSVSRKGRTEAPLESVRTEFELDVELVAFVVHFNS